MLTVRICTIITNKSRRQFEFFVVTPLIDKIPKRGRQYLLMQSSKQIFRWQEVLMNISGSHP